MKVAICPYCGDTQQASERCRSCGGLFEPLSRQATHNAMGPWFVRDEHRPFQPGASYETLVKMVERGQLTRYSIVRSPTTKQFWTVARRVPGVAHLLGYCHNCDASVDPGDHGCHACGVPFGAYMDRNYLGLPDLRPLPWEPGGGAGAAAGENPAARPEPASPRTFDFRRAGEPLGISSFASDEELRGSGLSPMPGRARPGSRAAQTENHSEADAPTFTATLPYPQPHAAPHAHAALAQPPGGMSDSSATQGRAPALAPATESAATRAMQRRMRQQQQTIRFLGLALLGVVVIASVTVAAVLAMRGASRGSAPEPNTAASPARSPAQVKGSDSRTDQASGSGAPPRTPATGSEASKPTTSPALPGSTQPDTAIAQPGGGASNGPASNGESDAGQAGRQRTPADTIADARGLLEAARDEARPSADRIADYERAIALLREAAAVIADDPAHANDVAAEIDTAERELERLRLKEFFP